MPRIVVEKNIAVPMRDGCVLRADLFRPDLNEKLPVLLNRMPYNKTMPMVFTGTLDAIRAAEAGYNVLVQDCRGRFASDGVWNCFTDEARDGYDTIEWAAAQPWANGKVGTYGASYMGATQWLAATQAPPSLKAMCPSITASDYHDGWTYNGGAFSLFFNVSWTMAALAPGAAAARTRRQSGGDRRAWRGDEFDRRHARADEVRAAQQVPDVPRRGAVLFRLAGASGLRRILAGAVDRRESHEDQRARVEYRRMVRHLSAWHAPQLHRHARGRRDRRGSQRTAPDRRTVESCGAIPEPGGRGRFRIPFGPGVSRYRRPAVALLRQVAQRKGRRRWRISGADFRDGRQSVARRKRMAARPHRVPPLLLAQPRPRQQYVRRRRARRRIARRRAARLVSLQSARSGSHCRRRAVLLSGRAAGRCVRSGRRRASRRRAGLLDRAARRRRRGDRADRTDPLRLVVVVRHGLHREAGRRQPVRHRCQSHRRNNSRAMANVARDAGDAGAGQSRRVQNRYVEHVERVQEGASHSPGGQLV